MKLKTSTLNNVDGSAEVTTPRSKVIVSVSGPIESKIRQELPNMASLEIIVRPSVGLSTTRENTLVDKLRSILSSVIVRHKYPRQLIQIVVQVLTVESDSIIINNFPNAVDDLKVFNLEFSDIINCCFFALIDSNISLFQSFIALNQSVTLDNELVLNPSLSQVINGKSSHLIVFTIANSKPTKVLFIDSKGTFSEDELMKVLDNGFTNATVFFEEFKNLIEEKIDNDLVWKLG